MSVIMGVITTKHGMGECTFTWMNNNEYISTGSESCIVRINQPGSYNVIIEHNGVSYSFETPLIVSKSNRSQPLQYDLSNITNMVNLGSQEAPQQLESLNKHTAFVSEHRKMRIHCIMRKKLKKTIDQPLIDLKEIRKHQYVKKQ